LLKAALLVLLACWTGALAAEGPQLSSSRVILLLVEDRGCPYCARWDREVGPGYVRSPEGHFAPLVRRYRGSPDVASLAVMFSPTFVVLKDGQEIGRIVGYSGPDFFWSELSPLLDAAGIDRSKS
jgi:hypothetical protein